MITADFHTHTAFSSDSEAAPELMIEQAIRLGLKMLCITDHYDHLFPEQYELSFVFDMDAWFDRLAECREKYRGQIKLLAGVELGLRDEPDVLPQCADFYRALAARYPFDFIIGSTHVLAHLDPYYPEYWETRGAAEGMDAWFAAVETGIRSYDSFQVYGHLDYLVRYLPGDRKNYRFSDYADRIDVILRLLIEQGRGLELNTAGWRYGLPFAHPRPEILARYRELGGEILTIGSDAHAPEQLAHAFDRARELLLSLGFRYYTVFRERRPEFLPL
ncbi:MAG: histidinol-phosphatase HisJ family protein [Lachnospiraceae bacterium]|nr:histidinol-phosphatase HisJ family protein [Lachnospiraceae bacterium]